MTPGSESRRAPALSEATFEPLDQQGIAPPWLGHDAIVIATTDLGNVVYLRTGATELDTVYVTHHDGADTEAFAESMTHLLTKLRQTNPNA